MFTAAIHGKYFFIRCPVVKADPGCHKRRPPIMTPFRGLVDRHCWVPEAEQRESDDIPRSPASKAVERAQKCLAIARRVVASRS
ncbi:hypothetical protein BH18ACT6_BH18ACT6_03180 [soil metagenome]